MNEYDLVVIGTGEAAADADRSRRG